jgi:drug/metabolite transporter (DMT)-like permease
VMFALIAEAGPARMTLITYISPAVAIILGALVLDEPLTIGLAIGFPLVIMGSVLGTWRSTPAPAEAVGAGDEVVGQIDDPRLRGGQAR